MENFIFWLFNSFIALIDTLTVETVNFISSIFENYYVGDFNLYNFNINLSLFSETPILITNVYDLLLLTFSIFYTVIFIVIVWKIIKKVVIKITRWNKW